MQCLSHQFISYNCVSVHFISQQVSFKHLKQIADDALPNPCHAVALVLFCDQYEVSLKSVHCKTKQNKVHNHTHLTCHFCNSLCSCSLETIILFDVMDVG
jgi:hypothetical protein